MTDLKELIICIPSYKREHPCILSLVRNTPELDFFFCVRRSEYEAGFYNKSQFEMSNLRFMLLDNVNCIGETREAILQHSIDDGYKYCLMIDDTQFCIHDSSNRINNFSSILKVCLNRFETDKLAKRAVAFNFSRKSFAYSIDKHETYFITQLCQTYILNLDLVKKYDLHFKRMDLVGVEDLVFYYELCKKGLVVLSDTRFMRIGLMPSARKQGGCHVGNEHRSEKDVQSERFAILDQYFKKMGYKYDFIKRVDSVLYPGTFYYKLNTKYAIQQLVDCYPTVKKLLI